MENRIEDVEEIDTLIAELEISKDKGNLILCVVNSPLYRDMIIQTLRVRFPSKVIDVKNSRRIIDILKRTDFDGAHVLMWKMPEEATEDLLNTLNNFRELFYESNIPNIVFYNQGFSENIIRKAPDFWRYRGNYYEFKEIEEGLTFEALGALTTPLTYKDKEDLLRRKRINEYLLEKVMDKKEKSKIFGELGLISDHLGELDKALEYYEDSLKLCVEMGIKNGMAINYGNMGNVYRMKGELNKALEYHEKALKLDEELGRKKGMAIQLGNIGGVYQDKRELDKALQYTEKALKLDEELGRKEGMAANYGNLGNVYAIKGELDKALEYHEKSLKIYEEMGRKVGMARNYGNIGNDYRIKGELDKALEYLEKALKLSEEMGKKYEIAGQLGNLGIVYKTKGELDKALEYYEMALKLNEEMGRRIQIARTLRNIGNIIAQKGEKKRALDYYLEAQNIVKGSSISESIAKRRRTLQEKEITKS